ncbi:hypothetical protein C8Q77DRAFT_1279539 [Trametes polyzona]|nr:hypothetical protein C8Q77DRAFT_1279539 [Trametes polyzona]
MGYSAWSMAFLCPPSLGGLLCGNLPLLSTALEDVVTTVVTDIATSTPASITTSDASTSSASLISITALPPAKSGNSVTRSRSSTSQGSSGFHIVYLAPLFAILGAVAGALCVWSLYRFVPTKGRPRQREPSLEPGPRYTPPSRFRNAATLTPAPLEGENLARPSQSSARPLLEPSAAEERNKGSWISRALSSRSRAKTPAPMEERPDSAEADNGAEYDPFLDQSSAAGTPASSGARLGRQGTTRTAFSQRLTSPDPYGALSDDEELAPYETLRHKSIRRGILERLRLGTLRRPPIAAYERGDTEDDGAPTSTADVDASPSAGRSRVTNRRRGHKRDSSDAQVVDMRSPARTVSTEGTEAPSRRPTLSRNCSELVTSPPGFRLVVEDPESGALMSAPPSCTTSPAAEKETGGTWGWSLPWQASPVKQRDGDKFTALPVRRSLADKRSSPYASPSPSFRGLNKLSTAGEDEDAEASRPTVANVGVPAAPPLSRVDSSILPASPPMVTSPPLNSQLFFGAVSPDFGSNPSLDLRYPEAAASTRPTHAHRASATDASGSPSNRLSPKKLKTQRSPPPLPFPSTDSSSPYRVRLKKTPTKKHASTTSTSTTSHRRPPTVERDDSADSVDAPSAAGRGTPLQRHEARHSALSRVGEILSRGWSERQLVGDALGGPGVRSPLVGQPLGGSLEKLVDEEALNGIGIEQRLGALRG